jgi:hypothetical protein
VSEQRDSSSAIDGGEHTDAGSLNALLQQHGIDGLRKALESGAQCRGIGGVSDAGRHPAILRAHARTRWFHDDGKPEVRRTREPIRRGARDDSAWHRDAELAREADHERLVGGIGDRRCVRKRDAARELALVRSDEQRGDFGHRQHDVDVTAPRDLNDRLDERFAVARGVGIGLERARMPRYGGERCGGDAGGHDLVAPRSEGADGGERGACVAIRDEDAHRFGAPANGAVG